MPKRVRISEVNFSPAPERLLRTGLVGWVSFVIDGRFWAGGISVRRSREGRNYLAYPSRDDGSGKRREYLKPIRDRVRREIERQVLDHLGEMYL